MKRIYHKHEVDSRLCHNPPKGVKCDGWSHIVRAPKTGEIVATVYTLAEAIHIARTGNTDTVTEAEPLELTETDLTEEPTE
ncbi:hypothetical protein [Rubinisphaera brasiliensis]|uniref:Uncharacterized protein n=1 Tax=Rubinisphaera brasiliensis (strain ATCC 49424 / DSM 5305 / JCM 21570 / IAM 15109 / NBRC 103401 / IFAM 1448) TaxID=756272 RepID=F0SPF4_RUBBR|nr:hypothetical protein [Rubinisphaera brasiliensis]ADY57858.1 hypothetical protein Plabr_0229 [Rubinisphaera brasiliensis DSM 5305]